MTVNVQVPEQYHAGDGVTVSFAVPFLFILSSDLVVTTIDGGVESVVAFTATGGNFAGGAVQLSAPAAIGTQVRIRRRTSLDQLVDYISNGGHPADATERGLDKATMTLQEINYRVGLLESGSATVGLAVANLGAGVQVLEGTLGGTVRARSLTAGSGISFVQSATEIQIAAAAGGGALVAANNLSDLVSVATARTNLGLGTAALASSTSFLAVASNLGDVASRQVALNNLSAVGSATNEHVLTKDTATGNAIWKSVPAGGGGEVNTASNQGSGAGLVMTKVGVDLPFKSVAIGLGLSQSVAADTITHMINQAASLTWTGLHKFNGATAEVDLSGSDYGLGGGVTGNRVKICRQDPGTRVDDKVEAAAVISSKVTGGSSINYAEWNLLLTMEDHSNKGAFEWKSGNSPLHTKGIKYGTSTIWGATFLAENRGGSLSGNMYGIEAAILSDEDGSARRRVCAGLYYGSLTGSGTPSKQYAGVHLAPIAAGPDQLLYGLRLEGSMTAAVVDMSTVTASPVAIDMAAGSRLNFTSGTGQGGNQTWWPGGFTASLWDGEIEVMVDGTKLYFPVRLSHH